MAFGKVKKSILKCKKDVADMSEASFIKGIRFAKTATEAKELSFSSLLDEASVEKLREIKEYMKTNKANTSKKLEKIVEWHDNMKLMVQVRDYVNEAVAHAKNKMHDAIIKEASNGDEETLT